MSATDPYADFADPVGPSPAAPPSTPFAGLQPQDAKKAWDDASASLEQQIAGHTPAQQNRARTAFFNDPRIQQIRALAAQSVTMRPGAHAPIVTTKQQEIQNIARANVQAGQGRDRAYATGATLAAPPLAALMQSPGAATAFLSSALDTGSFGLGDRLRAGIGSLTNGHSYADNLALAQEETRQRNSQSTMGNIIGSILGSVPSAVTGAGLVGAAGDAVAGAAPTLGRILSGASNMGVPEQLARAAVGGGAAGGAQAAGHGEDITRGAELGAASGAAFVGGGKTLGLLGKQAADVLNLGNASAILKRITTMTVPEAKARLAEAQAKGYEPTLFEILGLKERNNISSSVVNRSDNTLEQAQGLIQSRLANVGPEMASVTEQATAPGRQQIVNDLTGAMTDARGTPTAPVAEMPGDNLMAAKAAQAPMDLANKDNPDSQIRREARAIMAPHDNRTLYNNLDDILPPPHEELQDNGEVHMVPSDPAVTAVIKRKAGLLSRKDAGEVSGGLTGRNVSDLLGELNAEAGNVNNPARDVARSAAQHIEGLLAQDHPEFLEAHGRMRVGYAARARSGEGMAEGMNTRTEESIKNPGSEEVNAYRSAEGTQGRFLGQANQLQNTFAEASPAQAIRAAAALPGDQAAIAQNLGPEAAAPIMDTAAAQTKGMQALAGLNQKSGTNAASLGPDQLVGTILGLDPASMIRTKIMAVHNFVKIFGVSEQKSAALVDMLFSTNPAKRAKVLSMLNSTPKGADALASIAQGIGAGSAVEGRSGAPAPPPQAPPAAAAPPSAADAYAEFADPAPEASAAPEQAAPAVEAVPETPAAPAIDPGDAALIQQLDNGDPEVHAMLQQILHANNPEGSPTRHISDTEGPEFENLIERQFHQESGGHHFNADGTVKTSSKGAKGIAQVMPGTAPIAARMAGLPFSRDAYLHNPAYNKALGVAYMKNLVQNFKGDAAKALAAYDWGPGRVQAASVRWGDNWLSHAPLETRNYVSRILSG